MKKSLFTLAVAVAFAATASAQETSAKAQAPAKPVKMTAEMTAVNSPIPPIVDPGYVDVVLPAPSDAIILLGKEGKMDEWKSDKGDGPSTWKSEKNGVMTVEPNTGNLLSKRSFNDCQLHVEWRSPNPPTGKGQDRGNSGIFMQNLYEIQILDSYDNTTYVNGQAGAIYKQSAPLVNPCRKPGQWNTYDIVFIAPRFNDKGQMLYPARITLIFNGVLVQNDFQLTGPTLNSGIPRYGEPYVGGPIRLQDHHHPVSFRNIWIREL